MSLGSLGMAPSAPAAAFLLPLALLLHVTQGQRGVELIRHEKMEVTEGQDVALPCILRTNTTEFSVANIEWKKDRDEATKLVLYHPPYEPLYSWPNITLQMEKDSMDSYLKLHGVTIWDSGIYTCVLSTYPWGSVLRKTELKIRDPDVEVACDRDSPLVVEVGGNVSIRCEASPGSRYMWTKNNSLVSETDSLELWRVTQAHAGLYNLTVNTGAQEKQRSQHKEFFISVLRATTSQGADPELLLPQSTSALEAATTTDLAGSMPANNLWATDVTRNMTAAAHVTDDFAGVGVTAGEDVTPQLNLTQPAVTSSPPITTEQDATDYNSDWQINQTFTSVLPTFTEKAPSSSPSAGYATVPFKSTQGASSQSDPEVYTSTSLEGTQVNVTSDPVDTHSVGLQTYVFLLPAVIVVLILICGVCLYYRQHMIKSRMDLPPPFKPPPPPVKYTSARRSDTVTESTARSKGTFI